MLLPNEMWRPPMTRQPGPRRKPGALSWKAMTELLTLLQERPAISDNAIPTGFVLKSLDMAPGMFFIQRRVRFGSPQIVAYERGVGRFVSSGSPKGDEKDEQKT